MVVAVIVAIAAAVDVVEAVAFSCTLFRCYYSPSSLLFVHIDMQTKARNTIIRVITITPEVTGYSLLPGVLRMC